jgi:hypothetical protein
MVAVQSWAQLDVAVAVVVVMLSYWNWMTTMTTAPY